MVRLKLMKVFGILLGIAAIAMSVVVFSGSVGYFESFHQYGGDAYTGIQNAAAQTANNVLYLGQTVQMALGFFLLLQGLVLLLGALCIRTKQPVKSQPAPAPMPQPEQPAAPVQPVLVETFQAPQQPAQWNCAHCGTTNEPDYLFCQGCGKSK